MTEVVLKDFSSQSFYGLGASISEEDSAKDILILGSNHCNHPRNILEFIVHLSSCQGAYSLFTQFFLLWRIPQELDINALGYSESIVLPKLVQISHKAGQVKGCSYPTNLNLRTTTSLVSPL